MSEISNGIHFNIGISGLNNAGRTRNVVRRFIWLVIFLVGLAFTLFSTIVVVLDMLEYPVDTTVTRTMQNYVPRAYRNTLTRQGNVPLSSFQVKFPAVTVCNQNRVDCSMLASTIQACDHINSTSCPLLGEPGKEILTQLKRSCPSDSGM